MKKYYLIFLIGMLTLPFIGSGQTAILMGEITDDISNNPLPNVTVNVKSADGKIIRSVSADERFGEYEIDSLNNGIYTLEYKCEGYKTRHFHRVEIFPKHILVKNVKLIQEFSRFSNKQTTASLEHDYYEDENVTVYLMYSGLTMILVAALALR